MSKEDWIARGIDNRRREERQAERERRQVVQAPRPPVREPLAPDIRALAEQFSERRDAEMLSMDDAYFVATKDPVQRAHDMSEVLRLERKFETKDDESLLASAFEHVIMQRLNGPSHWLGEHMKAQLTARFDDYVNKLDLYVEDTRAESGKPIGLSIDITFSRDRATIEGKIRDLKEKLLDGGRLAQLKYYKPLGGGPASEGAAIALPKVIVGVERAAAIGSMQSLAAAEKDGTEAEKRDWMTGITILYQMNEQLKAYLWYTRAHINPKEKPHVAATIARYEEVLADIEEVFKTTGFDYAAVKKFAEQSVVTQIIAQKLNQELGYSSQVSASDTLVG